jgi:hypothetical protein
MARDPFEEFEFEEIVEELAEDDTFDQFEFEEEQPEVSRLEALKKGVEQGATFGMAEELGAAAGTAGYRAGLPEGAEDPLSVLERYRKIREEARGEYTGAKEARPYTTAAGELAGGALTMGLRPIGALAKTLKGTAGLGAAYGVGAGEADITTGEIPQAALEAGFGGLMGAIGRKAGERLTRATKEKVLPAIRSLAGKAEQRAEMGALKSIGAPKEILKQEMRAGFTARPTPEKVQGIGRELLKRDVVRFAGGPAKAIDLIDKNLNQVWGVVENEVQRVDDILASEMAKVTKVPAVFGAKIKVKLPITPLKKRVQELINKEANKMKKLPGGQEKANKFVTEMNEHFDNIISENEYNLQELLNLKHSFGQAVSKNKWNQNIAEKMPSSTEDYLKKLNLTIKDYTEELADAINPGSGEIIRSFNKTYGNLTSARNAAFNQLLKKESRTGANLGDYLTLGVGSSLGGLPGGFGALAAKRGTEALIGRTLPEMIGVAETKTLSKLSKHLAKVGTPEAGRLSRTLVGIARNPDVSARLGAMTSLLADKNVKKLMSEAKKEIKEDKEEPENIPAKLEDSSKESISEIHRKVKVKYGEGASELSRVLEQVERSPSEQRQKALMFSIMQNPEYRRMINDAMGKK